MLNVRNVREDDIKKIAKLEQLTFLDAWTEKSIQETFLQPQAFIVIAETEEVLAGYCVIYYVLDEGEIARIAVNPTLRRQGVGRKILDYVKSVCEEKRITTLLLDVRESNESARSFYKTYGFVEDGVRKNFYDMPKEHAVLMSKQLV